MKNTREAASTNKKIRAAASVLLSYISLIFVQSAVSGIFTFFGAGSGMSGAIVDFLSYLSGFISSSLVYKYSAAPVNKQQNEVIHTEAESETKAVKSVSFAKYTFYTSGALTLILFTNICFACFRESSNSVTPVHNSLIFSSLVGILIKSPLEEALFRKAYLKNLTGTLGSLPSVLTVSVLFGAWHPAGSRIFAFISSIILGALYLGIREITNDERTDRAFICTSVCHASFNASMYIAEAVYVHFDLSVFGTVCTEALLSALIFASSAASLTIKKRRQAMR